MNFKLDENLGRRTQEVFSRYGHRADTVAEENLSGTSGQHLFEICQVEARCLVSLDMDLADILRFPPGLSRGVVVLRPPQNPTPALLAQMVVFVLEMLSHESVDGRLWIAEPGRIRVHEPGLGTDEKL